MLCALQVLEKMASINKFTMTYKISSVYNRYVNNAYKLLPSYHIPENKLVSYIGKPTKLDKVRYSVEIISNANTLNIRIYNMPYQIHKGIRNK